MKARELNEIKANDPQHLMTQLTDLKAELYN